MRKRFMGLEIINLYLLGFAASYFERQRGKTLKPACWSISPSLSSDVLSDARST